MIYEIQCIRLSDKGLLYFKFKSGFIIFGLGLAKIWWDSPFSKVMSPGTHHFRTLVRTLTVLNFYNKKFAILCIDSAEAANSYIHSDNTWTGENY